MKNLLPFALLVLIFTSCDPISDIEANIENLTSETLTIDFVSSDNSFLNKTLQLAPNEIKLFQEGSDIGSTYLEPSIDEYDSVVIKNQAEDILRVFKAEDAGKNFYKIDDWISSEPRKRFFKYEYQIENEDIQ
ncbi:hypothetical protein [Roseivirga sp.]|uniref:hypothetical protein n=1 Tax=Roseivirga sp. TaxID=1964215 RepID=UPI003B8DB528